MPALLLAALVAGCSRYDGPRIPQNPLVTSLTVREVAAGLTNPLYLTAPPGDGRLFIVEQPGRIRVVDGGRLLPEPFLDLTAKVLSGGERGLLSVAFHPEYGTNGHFYVYYTDLNGDITVERYAVSSDPNVADAGSAALVLSIPHRLAGNHNGGLLQFGPDHTLYVGTGDGGGAGDPQGNGQNLGSLLGKLLRIDVNHGPIIPYAIPASNPFVGRAGARGEVWALGLRNPWRFAFDTVEGRLYVADVGQNRLEEVSVAGISEAGVNYGWNVMEANACYASNDCDRTGLRLPVIQYSHDGGACSITGGYVYRGSAAGMAGVRGHYFYSDYCAGWLRSFRLASDGTVAEERSWPVPDLGNVLSFGQDSAGELYILSATGRVFQIVPADESSPRLSALGVLRLSAIGPRLSATAGSPGGRPHAEGFLTDAPAEGRGPRAAVS